MTSKITRRDFLQRVGVGAALFAAPALRLSAQEQDAPLRPTLLQGDAVPERPVVKIAHCCDPQLGFDGPDAYEADLKRLEKEIEKVNALRPDLVFFAGDMVNKCEDLEKDWPAILQKIDAPILVAPGNHDIPEPVTGENVARFVKVFDREYSSLEFNGWRFVVLNTQYCRPECDPTLYTAQVEWMREELAKAKEAGQNVVVGSHIPPFVKSPDEEDAYFNIPMTYRAEYLDYLAAHNVYFYLAGHTHTTLQRDYKGLPILNGETTSKNFDKRPFGFRFLQVDSKLNYAWTFHPVE